MRPRRDVGSAPRPSKRHDALPSGAARFTEPKLYRLKKRHTGEIHNLVAPAASDGAIFGYPVRVKTGAVVGGIRPYLHTEWAGGELQQRDAPDLFAIGASAIERRRLTGTPTALNDREDVGDPVRWGGHGCAASRIAATRSCRVGAAHL